jgi:hypothetical protein
MVIFAWKRHHVKQGSTVLTIAWPLTVTKPRPTNRPCYCMVPVGARRGFTTLAPALSQRDGTFRFFPKEEGISIENFKTRCKVNKPRGRDRGLMDDV